jgi:hypothetical protein
MKDNLLFAALILSVVGALIASFVLGHKNAMEKQPEHIEVRSALIRAASLEADIYDIYDEIDALYIEVNESDMTDEEKEYVLNVLDIIFR